MSLKSLNCIFVLILLFNLTLTKNLKKQDIIDYNDTTKENIKDKCDAGFKWEGVCKVARIEIPDSSIPIVKSTVDYIIRPLIRTVVPEGAMCYGDFNGQDVNSSNEHFRDMTCDSFPLEAGLSFGIIGATLKNIPCVIPTNISFCMAFDRCGTLAISMNGGIAQCASTFGAIAIAPATPLLLGHGPGELALLMVLSSMVKHVSLGFSPLRKFTKYFRISYFDKTSDRVEFVYTKTLAHFYIGLGVALPFHDLRINGRPLGDIIGFDNYFKVLVDFGNVGSLVTNTIDRIRNANKDTAKEILHDIINIGSELTITYTGDIVVKLGSLTRGFLKDFTLNVAEASFLVTLGGNNASGKPVGVYIFLGSNLTSGLATIYNVITSHFAPILKKINFHIPELPLQEATLGIFFQVDTIGFDFKFPGLNIKCVFNIFKFRGGCDFGGKFFNVVMKAAEFIITHTFAFLGKTGKTIARVATGVGHFAKHTAESIKNLGKSAVHKAGEVAHYTYDTAKSVAGQVFSKW